jgi:hypothetical protein
MPQSIPFTHFIVRYEMANYRLTVVVAYAMSYQEATALLRVFVDGSSLYAPTSLYGIRAIQELPFYQQV